MHAENSEINRLSIQHCFIVLKLQVNQFDSVVHYQSNFRILEATIELFLQHLRRDSFPKGARILDELKVLSVFFDGCDAIFSHNVSFEIVVAYRESLQVRLQCENFNKRSFANHQIRGENAEFLATSDELWNFVLWIEVMSSNMQTFEIHVRQTFLEFVNIRCVSTCFPSADIENFEIFAVFDDRIDNVD